MIGRREALTFPRGAQAGIFMHGIFEKLDFSSPFEMKVRELASLDDILTTLRELVPSARIVFAHGQLPPRELEKIMMDFMQKPKSGSKLYNDLSWRH